MRQHEVGNAVERHNPLRVGAFLDVASKARIPLLGVQSLAGLDNNLAFVAAILTHSVVPRLAVATQIAGVGAPVVQRLVIQLIFRHSLLAVSGAFPIRRTIRLIIIG